MKKSMILVTIMILGFILISCQETEEVELTYDVKFIFDNLEQEEQVFTLKEDEKVNAFENPTRENFIFLGWFIDNDSNKPFHFEDEIDKDLVIYAMWHEIGAALNYTNALYAGGAADPHVIRHENTFYIYITGGVLLKSTDMVNWQSLGAVIARPTWGTQNANIWAPDIVKINDKFLLYYSLSVWGDANPGIGVAVADHPEGPWTDLGKLFNSLEIGVNNSIDPTVFVAEDGRVYMIWGSFRGNYGIELTADGLALKNGLNYARDNKVHIAGYDTSTSHNASTYEGQYVIFKDGFYYLFLSSGNCCEGLSSSYHIRVARSTNPLGPYIDHESRDMFEGYRGKVVLQASSRMIGPGHNSIMIDDKGEYWIVYHAYKTDDGQTHNNRQLAIDKLLWDEDGWPYVENFMPTNREQVGPFFRHLDINE